MDDTISALLQQAVDNLRETVGGEEQLQIDTICTALATLRPFVPVKVLASVSGVEVAAVQEFLRAILVVRFSSWKMRFSLGMSRSRHGFASISSQATISSPHLSKGCNLSRREVRM